MMRDPGNEAGPRVAEPPSSWFLSSRERLLWLSAGVVQIGIWSTLPLAGQLAAQLRDRVPLDVTFLVAFLLLMTAVAWGALRRSARRRDLWLAAALVAATALLVTRTGIPLTERSHLIEYGLVAVLILHALEARRAAGGAVRWPAGVAIVGTSVLGGIDESIQAVLPNRVFDPRDLLFNVLAACMTVGLTLLLRVSTHWMEAILRPK